MDWGTENGYGKDTFSVAFGWQFWLWWCVLRTDASSTPGMALLACHRLILYIYYTLRVAFDATVPTPSPDLIGSSANSGRMRRVQAMASLLLMKAGTGINVRIDPADGVAYRDSRFLGHYIAACRLRSKFRMQQRLLLF